MAEKKLSPRQKMINMMYLVLTALLALNVSKEVLNSFFTVNSGIVRTTSNFDSKNERAYQDFANAARNNEEKFGEVAEKANVIKKNADSISEFIQSMKFKLVYIVDKGQIALGDPSDSLVIDNKGKPVPYNKETGEGNPNFLSTKNNGGEPYKWKDLTSEQKKLPIAYLKNKKERTKAGALFYDTKRALATQKDEKATQLKNQLIDYREMLIKLVPENTFLIDKIKNVLDFSDVMNTKKGKLETWEKYNFYDMPAVAAVTIMSQIQSDVKNIESDVISYLMENIDEKTLKFDSVYGITVAKKSVVLKGDEYVSDIFLTATQKVAGTEVRVGRHDSILDENGKIISRTMIGEEGKDWQKLEIKNGKGIYKNRATVQGLQKYGGLISMKTESGTKFYPFKGEYLVAEIAAIASADWMNKIYIGIWNPVTVSVAGYSPSLVVPKTRNGEIRAVDKSKGKWEIKPSKFTTGSGQPIIDLYVNENSNLRKMGTPISFRVVPIRPIYTQVARKQNGLITGSKLINSGKIVAKPADKDIPTNAVRFSVISYYYKMEGAPAVKVEGNKFTDILKRDIGRMLPNETVSFSRIVVKQDKCKACPEEKLESIMQFTIQ